MDNTIPQLTGLFRDVLELCDVTPDESVLVVSQPESRDGYEHGMLTAAESLDASVNSLTLPGFKQPMFPYGGSPGGGLDLDNYIQEEPSVKAALKNADMVLDITAEGLVHTKARSLTLDNGARMLSCWAPPAILERMFPRQSLRERVEAGEKMLENTTEMRITSEAGTDVRIQLASDPPTVAQYGYTDEPGRWDNFASGFVATYPESESPEGTIVLDTGDVILPMNRYIDQPVKMVVEDGFVTDIQGASADAELLRSYLSRWDSRDPYGTSHFGFGLDETAVWESIAFFNGTGIDIRGMDNRSYLGSFMWSTGPNRFAGRDTRAHLDFPMRNCSIYLDDDLVIDTGDVVDERLHP